MVRMGLAAGWGYGGWGYRGGYGYRGVYGYHGGYAAGYRGGYADGYAGRGAVAPRAFNVAAVDIPAAVMQVAVMSQPVVGSTVAVVAASTAAEAAASTVVAADTAKT